MIFAFTTTILLNNEEVEVEVSGRYTPGTKSTFDEPPESGDADIHSIRKLENLEEIDVPDEIYAELCARAYDEACEQFEEEVYERDDDDDRPEDDDVY